MEYKKIGETYYVRMDRGDEIISKPTVGGSIGRKFDPETGTGFWNFNTVR